jgi:hypothetical protein
MAAPVRPAGLPALATSLPVRETEPAPEEPETLAPESDEFLEKVETAIPARLREAAARCYKGGLDGNLTLKITYRLRVVNGEVFTSNAYASNSELGNRELERCMVAAVAAARWNDASLPDWDEENELFIRLRSLIKHRPVEEQIELKRAAQVRDDDGDEGKADDLR